MTSMTHDAPQARRLETPAADPLRDRWLEAIDQLALVVDEALEACRVALASTHTRLRR